MKAISLHQPWAQLVALGLKHYETRSWSTKHRGPLAIHAAKRKDQGVVAAFEHLPIAAALARAGIRSIEALSFGAIVCVVDVAQVYQVGADGNGKGALWAPARMSVRSMPTGNELEFGDFSVGRYAWLLDNLYRIPTPIDCRGYQQIWDLDAETSAKVEAALAEVLGA